MPSGIGLPRPKDDEVGNSGQLCFGRDVFYHNFYLQNVSPGGEQLFWNRILGVASGLYLLSDSFYPTGFDENVEQPTRHTGLRRAHFGALYQVYQAKAERLKEELELQADDVGVEPSI